MKDTLTSSLVPKIQHPTPRGSAVIEEYRFASDVLYIKLLAPVPVISFKHGAKKRFLLLKRLAARLCEHACSL